MALPWWIVIPVGVLFVAFIVFALRQGATVNTDPESTPPSYPGEQP
ncbi:hypothetical protein AB7813_12335 [Tardiphaga sp. 20_F10_N6_6]|jgi:hypothetical protein